MSEEYESSIHTYFKNSAVCVGDLMCEIEENNEHDKYAVVVKMNLDK